MTKPTLYHLRSPIGGFLASFRADSDLEASAEGRRILTKLGRVRGYVQAAGRRIEVAAEAPSLNESLERKAEDDYQRATAERCAGWDPNP